MASSTAQLRAHDDIQVDIKRLWKSKKAEEVDPYYIEELWWVIQRLQFRIAELEHPEWYMK